MDENYKVSIITPTYNCAQFIQTTIESVQQQTYTNWELIIVDDCSTDDTENIVKNIAKKDGRIKYYLLDKNRGAAVARTKAMEYATGDYIAFLDSDDLWMCNKLEYQLNYMLEYRVNFTCTSYEQIDESGCCLGKTIKCIPKTTYNRLLLDCPVGNSTVMYNVAEMGKFEVPDIRKRNDDALWLKMLKKEPYIVGIPKVLMQYRIRDNSISSNKLSLIKYHWHLYRKIENLSFIRAIFHICFWGCIKVFKFK